MKTHIIKLLYLLMIPWSMVSLSAQSVFDSNRANVWVIDGERSQSFSVNNWSDFAQMKEGSVNIVTENGDETPINGVLNSQTVIVNNVAKSAPNLSTHMPSFSLIGLDAPSNSGTDMRKPLLTISPDGGEFNETIEVLLTLNAPVDASYPVVYVVDNKENQQILMGEEGKNSITLYFSSNGVHTVKYGLKGEDNLKTATFTMGGVSAKKDSDEDGIPDAVEIELGMNPLDNIIPDSDNDGWNDFDEFLRKTDNDANDSTPEDSDGDGWSDFDEDLRGTDPHNSAGCIDKPTARSLYGVEYHVNALAYLGYDETTTQIPVLKRVSLVSIDALKLFDTQEIENLPKVFEIDGSDYNGSVCHMSKSDLNTTLLAGDIPTMRAPADLPIITRVQEKYSDNNNTHVVKAWTKATTAVTLQAYLASAAFDDLAQNEFDAEDFRMGYVAYLKDHLLVSKNVMVHQASSFDVALVEQAFKSREAPVEVRKTEDDILKIIMEGKGAMPGKMVDGSDAEEIASWMMNGMKGSQPTAFSACAACHGTDAAGITGLAPDIRGYAKEVAYINLDLLLGNPDNDLSSTTYTNVLSALSEEPNRTTDNLYEDVLNLNLTEGADMVAGLNDTFTVEPELADFNLTTEEILATSLAFEEVEKYKLSLMTIMSKTTADGNVSVWNMSTDTDGDMLLNKEEVFPVYYTHPLRGDGDGDGMNDKEDPCPYDKNNECLNANNSLADSDEDGVADAVDNCPFTANFDQDDSDADGIGDACAKNGIVMLTPRTNIQLFKGESFEFVARKTEETTSKTIWLVNDVDVAGNQMQYQHVFDTLGTQQVCVALEEGIAQISCVKVTVLEREVHDVVNIYARDITEGDSGIKNLLVEVTLDEALPIEKRYMYQTIAKTATKNVDYLHVNGELVFAAGEVRKYLNISILGDLFGESDETFVLKVGDVNKTLTIINDDASPILTAVNPHIIVTEGTGLNHIVSFNFELDVAPTVTATVDFSTQIPLSSSGLYEAIGSVKSGTSNRKITFEAGQTTASMAVTVLADNIDEDNANVHICLNNPQNLQLVGTETCVTVTVNDDDAEPTVSFDPSSLTVSESSGKVYGTLKLSHLSTRGATAFVSVSDASTATDEDYTFTDVNVSFVNVVRDGDLRAYTYVTEKRVELNITDDDEVENLEKVILEIGNTEKCIADESNKQLTVNIQDNETPDPRLTIRRFDNAEELASGNINEGDKDRAITVRLHLSKPVEKSGTSVHYALLMESTPIPDPDKVVYPEYHSMLREVPSGDITFEIGEQDKEFTIIIIGDMVKESNKAFTIQLSNAINIALYDMGDDQFTQEEQDGLLNIPFNIVDDDYTPIISFEKSTYTTAEGEKVHIKLLLSEKSYQTIEVNLTVHGDSTAEDSEDMDIDDYNLSTKHLVIYASNPNESSDNLEAMVDVNITQGQEGEDDETIILDISSSKNAVINEDANRTTITIEEEAVLTPLASHAYFKVQDSEWKNELWQSDASVLGTERIFDGIFLSCEAPITRVGDALLYFVDTHQTLYKSDGTTTEVVKSFENLTVSELLDINGVLYFIVADYENETTALWKSEGSEVSTVKIVNLFEGYGMEKMSLTLAGDNLYFQSDINSTTEGDIELHKFNITTEEIHLVKDITEGDSSWGITNFINADGVLYFTNGNAIWKSNGTEAGTVVFREETGLYDLTGLQYVNDILYYVTHESPNSVLHGINLKTDENYDIATYPEYQIANMWAVNNKLYLSVDIGSSLILQSVYNDVLTEVKTFGDNNEIHTIKDKLASQFFFFVHYSDPETYEGFTNVWKSDGTEEGTVQLTDNN